MKPPVIQRKEKKIVPDLSVNQDELTRMYYLNPYRWDKAFRFLGDADLENFPKGRFEIDGNDLYASFDEYITKNEEDTKLEAHRIYADIQYIISGKEMIGISPLSSCSETVSYDPGKDICFLKSNNETPLKASPDRYFIFFPSDAHRPCLKDKENETVKKVVVKVRVG